MGLFGPSRRPRPARVASPERIRHSRANALAASGARQREQRGDLSQQSRLAQPWQARAFAYYDLVPEVKYASQFYSRISALRLFAGEFQDDGDDLVETSNPEALEQLERIQDPGGGRSTLLATYGRLMFLVGEAQLFVSRDTDADVEQWEMLSADEIRFTGDGYQRYRAPSLQPEQYREQGDDDWEPVDDENAVAYRLWRRHPRYSHLADATLQGSLDIAEELVLLTQAVRARARSRLAGSGILIVNGNMVPVPQEALTDEDPELDPFVRDLTMAMTQPIADEGSPSAVVPLVVRVDADKLEDVMKHVQIVDPMQLYPETGLRREAVERLAVGLDMPPEILLGISDANHWSGWTIDEQAWKAHLQQIAQQLCDDLTAAFYRPTLRSLGVSDWQRYAIGYDASALINHPDRGKDAKDLFDRRALSKKTLRDAVGFDDDDEMPDDELAEQIGVQLRDAQLAVTGVPSAPAPAGEPLPQEDGTDGGQANETDKNPPAQPSQTDETPSERDARQAVAAAGLNGQVTAARILGASDLALQRARELAGSRLRNYAKRDSEATKIIDGVPNCRVAAALGLDRARALGAPPERALVEGVGPVVEDALHLWRIDQAIAEPLATRIEQHAARTLYQERPEPLPPSFTAYLQGLRIEAP